MAFANILNKAAYINKDDYLTFLKLLNPFAPHIAEELNQQLGNKEDLVYADWPSYDDDKLVESTMEIVISINGKVRDKLVVSRDIDKETLLSKAKNTERIQELIEGKTIRKEIYVPNKLINLVV